VFRSCLHPASLTTHKWNSLPDGVLHDPLPDPQFIYFSARRRSKHGKRSHRAYLPNPQREQHLLCDRAESTGCSWSLLGAARACQLLSLLAVRCRQRNLCLRHPIPCLYPHTRHTANQYPRQPMPDACSFHEWSIILRLPRSIASQTGSGPDNPWAPLHGALLCDWEFLTILGFIFDPISTDFLGLAHDIVVFAADDLRRAQLGIREDSTLDVKSKSLFPSLTRPRSFGGPRPKR